MYTNQMNRKINPLEKRNNQHSPAFIAWFSSNVLSLFTEAVKAENCKEDGIERIRAAQ